ncbi:MAG: biopolymer transporter ExbD [Opitutaceae bacterium]|jgi:biopolymer transport protein TolR|nr:biopolymer transporter ExbD [Opitutaceae bacterium]
MARTFRRHRTAHPLADLNVTNLVDLAFVLLLIFMIATPLINQEQTIPINLPVESKRDQARADKPPRYVAVSIDRQGRYYVDASPVTFAELSLRLAALAAEPADRQPVIRIRADLTLQFQQVVRVMDELTKFKLSKIQFDTQTGGGAAP